MLVLNTGSTDNPRPKGQIQVIFGPMFSGKTTELIRRIRRYQIANHKCLIIKYANDLRYDSLSVATHDSQTLEAVTSTTLSDLKEDALNYSVIGIDEGQFFPDTVSFAESMANAGKVIIVAALDGTFQRKSFGDILHLVPLAESVIKLTAVCVLCFEEASFTRRLGNETKLEIIGGTDKYMAVCRRCYGIEPPVAKLAEVPKTTEKAKENQDPSQNI